MANRVGRAPRWQCRFGYLSASVGCPYGELPNFRTLRRPGRVFSDLYPAAFFSFRRSAAYKRGKQVARRRFFEKVASVFALPESTPVTAKPNHRRRDCAEGAFRQPRLCVSPRRTSPCRRVERGVREPSSGSRRCCGVAMATYEETNWSGRRICTMRHFGRVATGNLPRELSWQAEREPIMVNQVDDAPRRQRRLGYFSSRVDRPYGKKTN